MRLEHSFKTSPEPTQTTHLKPNRERFSAAVPSHCPPGYTYTPTSTFCARSTRTPKNPQPTLAPLEASERNLFNEPKELSSLPAQPKEEPISQNPIRVGSQWEPDLYQGQEIGDRGSNQRGPPLPLVKR
eukprot:scaffold6460_cov130-Isochrysis_galbana.AAC.7